MRFSPVITKIFEFEHTLTKPLKEFYPTTIITTNTTTTIKYSKKCLDRYVNVIVNFVLDPSIIHNNQFTNDSIYQQRRSSTGVEHFFFTTTTLIINLRI